MSGSSAHASSGPVPAGSNLFLLTDLREAPLRLARLAERLDAAPGELPESSDELLRLLTRLRARIFLPAGARFANAAEAASAAAASSLDPNGSA